MERQARSHIVLGVRTTFWSLYLGMCVGATLPFPRAQIHTSYQQRDCPRPVGTWKYELNENLPELEICVPLADGSLATIEHLPASTPTKTLGQMTCPTGSSDRALRQMCEKAQKWIDKAIEGRLHRRNLWFLLDKQFWPGVAFGISSIMASFAKLDQCMLKTYYGLLPLSGVRRSIQKEICQIDRGFYGCGFPHPGVECFIAQLSKLLTNYGCNTGLGIHMQTSMELMVIECGVSCQILAQPYCTFSKWVSHCWLKSVWEKVDLFGLTVTIKSLPLTLPQKNDEWMMRVLQSEGYTDDELVRLNRVRCHQQVLFTRTFSTPGVDPSTINTERNGQSGQNGLTLFFQSKTLQVKISGCGTMQLIVLHRKAFRNT